MKRKGPVLLGCVLVSAVACVFALFVALLLGSGGDSVSLRSPLGDKVGLVRIEEAIFDPKDAIEQIRYLARNRHVKALVVRIDSPGGAVGASQEIHNELLKAAEGEIENRPLRVVASFGNVAASGGYYVACAADRIVSNPGTLTGSIGVIFSAPEMTQLIDKFGLKFNTVKSGEFKDTGSFSRPMTDQDRALLQSVIDDVHGQFMDDVVQGRREAIIALLAEDPFTSGQATLDAAVHQHVRSIADGRIFSGRRAKELGLVDELGSLRDAVETACELAGIPADSEVIEKPKKGKLSDVLFGSAESAARVLMRSLNAPLQYRMPF